MKTDSKGKPMSFRKIEKVLKEERNRKRRKL
jgi:hypothetical protein